MRLPPAVRPLLIAAAALVALLLLRYLKLRSDHDAVVAKVPEVVAQIQDLCSRHYVRTVLHGRPAKEGDAIEAQEAAAFAMSFPPGDTRWATTDLYKALAEGQELPGQARDFVEAHAGELEAMRAATEYAWATPRLLRERLTPEALRAMVFAPGFLLARAAVSPPAACMAIAADVVRLRTDQMVGLPLDWDSAERRLEVPVAVELACAGHSTLEERAEAARAFDLMAKEPPPIGFLMGEISTVTEGLATYACREGLVPYRQVQVKAAYQCPSLRRALEAWTRDPDRWWTLNRDDFPSTRRAVAIEVQARHETVPWPDLDGEGVLPPVYIGALRAQEALPKTLDDMVVARARLVARMRATARALSPDGENGDPFAPGKPLGHREENGTRTVWSVGLNGVDDQGGGDDIAVHLTEAAPHP